jgi:hypothetical protein
MKSVVLFSYKQPYDGGNVRCGVLTHVRDTVRDPLDFACTSYRWNDPEFDRSRSLWTVASLGGYKKFYGERVNWAIRIPLLGSLILPLLRRFI